MSAVGESPREPSSALRAHRAARLAARDDVALSEGERPHLHVPNEILVGRDDAALLGEELAELGARELAVPGGLEERLRRFELSGDEPLATLIARLRSRGGERALRVAPHHVVSGLPYIQGGPYGLPTASEDRFVVTPGERSGVQIALLDTGFTPKLHPWLDARVDAGADTLEQTDVHPRDGWLDDEAGHGTFIAGLIVQRAPGATIRVAKVLDSEGYGTELALASTILEYAPEVELINLSLGCYSHDDQPPLALAEALRRVPSSTVIVAAAGNDATDRPLWPAAHKRVIAVAALDDRLRRAPFSNFGWWVDAATPAVDVLSTFIDFDEQGQVSAIPGRVPQNFRGWARWNGTSFAAPRLVGAIAAAMARSGGGTAPDAVAAVFSSGLSVDPELGVVLDL
jgi:subtilisin family serine protease